MRSGCGRRSLPAPRERHEQQQQREDLQAAEQHADHEHDLAQRREDGKASGRPDKGEPRPDVGQARECGGEIRREVQPVERHDQPGDEQDDDVEREVRQGVVDGLPVDRLAVEADVFHAARAQHLLDLDRAGFEQQHHARELQTAGGAAGAAADKHQQHEQELGVFRPEIEVRGGKAGRRDDRCDLEERIAQRMADAAVEIADVKCDRDDGKGDHTEEPAQLLVAQRGADVAEQDEVIQAEVDAEEYHEHAHDDVDIGAVVVADAQRARGQAAGAGGGERVQQRIVKAHAAGDEQNHLHERERDVQQVEDGGGLADARHELADRRAGHLGAHDVHRAVAAHGQHGQHEHEDAHAADPVRKQPPEHAAAGHALRRCDDAGAGRGQTRDRLKQGVDVVRDVAREHEQQRAEQRHGDPRQADDQKTVARGHAAGFCAHAPHDQPDAAGDGDRDQKRRPATRRMTKAATIGRSISAASMHSTRPMTCPIIRKFMVLSSLYHDRTVA